MFWGKKSLKLIFFCPFNAAILPDPLWQTNTSLSLTVGNHKRNSLFSVKIHKMIDDKSGRINKNGAVNLQPSSVKKRYSRMS